MGDVYMVMETIDNTKPISYLFRAHRHVVAIYRVYEGPNISITGNENCEFYIVSFKEK